MSENGRPKPFIVLVSEVETTMRSILEGDEADIPFAIYKAEIALAEAKKLASAASETALEKVVERPAGTESPTIIMRNPYTIEREPCFRPGDVIVHRDRRYTVLDPAWSPMGKLRMQAEGQAVRMTWWKKPSDLPPAYQLVEAVERESGE